MPMAVLQIRLEESLKNDVSALFDRLGMDIPTAVRIFFKRALVENGLPFEVKSTPRTPNGVALLAALRELNEEARVAGSIGMSEEEIEAEISAARAERAARQGKD